MKYWIIQKAESTELNLPSVNENHLCCHRPTPDALEIGGYGPLACGLYRARRAIPSLRVGALRFRGGVSSTGWIASPAALRLMPFCWIVEASSTAPTSSPPVLGRIRDEGTQRLVFAIGPADGWSAAARQRANLLFSFGRLTLPHQLARVVLAEQVYRALTILAGHPYHSGH